jgi:hypothetical protein
MGVTYYDSHAQGIKSAGNFHDLNGIGRSHLTQLHQAFGTSKRFPLRAGRYHGMQVEADLFFTHICSLYETIEESTNTAKLDLLTALK